MDAVFLSTEIYIQIKNYNCNITLKYYCFYVLSDLCICLFLIT